MVIWRIKVLSDSKKEKAPTYIDVYISMRLGTNKKINCCAICATFYLFTCQKKLNLWGANGMFKNIFIIFFHYVVQQIHTWPGYLFRSKFNHWSSNRIIIAVLFVHQHGKCHIVHHAYGTLPEVWGRNHLVEFTNFIAI